MTRNMMGKIFLFVIGSILLILFLYITGKTIIFLMKGVYTKGRVNEIVDSGLEIGKWKPVIEFRTASGEKILFSPNSGKDEDSYTIGQDIKVVYDPGFPEDARIISFFELLLAPLALLVFTALLLYPALKIPAGTQEALPQIALTYATAPDKLKYSLLYILLPGLFTLFGMIIIIMGIFETTKKISSYYWSSAAGVVTRSELGVSGKFYSPDIRYKFNANNKVYEGKRVDLAEIESGDPLPSQKSVKRYPQGKKVTVYYNPENPEESVLEPGIHGIPVDLVMLYGGGAGFLFFAWMAYVAVRQGWVE